MTVPFVLLVVARGVVKKLPRAVAALGVALVLALGVGSARAARSSDRSSVDYGGLSHALEARIAPDNWIVLKDDWCSAPLHFYFKEPRHHVVLADDLPGRLLEAAPKRMWIINFAGTPRVERLPELRARLAPCVATEEVRAKNIVARLFERAAGKPFRTMGFAGDRGLRRRKRTGDRRRGRALSHRPRERSASRALACDAGAPSDARRLSPG